MAGEEDATQREETNGVPTEDSAHPEAELSRATEPNCDTNVSPNAKGLDPLTVQRERRRRPTTAQDEELRWANLKTVLRGDESTLTHRTARDAWKMSDHFVLSEANMLYNVGARPLRSGQQAMLRLVVPSTMIQEILQNCQDSLEGGHQAIVRTFYRVKRDYYWIGIYADVGKHVQSYPDCSSSKSQPKIRVISVDFVIPLPKYRWGNTAPLLFQCAFTGFVMGKAMADTTALRVA
ncbi:reverse transcriptase [Phytophthora megakarya]|uniref:Reverse transcriptase n=1 Tax=Phytophthora megakarya TaxID=4795 RepID=A0A225VTT5_9STRA|nr:reverse transcriptase [Phytophthora megakarya]